MGRRNLFWGILVLIIGLIFLAISLGWLKGVNGWSLIWPVVLVFVGIWFLVSSLTRKQRPLERHDLAINKENDQEVAIKLEYGAGKLELGPSENPAVLVEGALLGEFAQVVTRDGNKANIKLSAGPHMFMDWPNTMGSHSLEWKLSLNKDLPMELSIESGASESIFNLTDLKITNLKLGTGASSNKIYLPAKAGSTQVKVDAGAASIDIFIPQGVAARIKLDSAISGNKVDNTRFPWNGKVYESSDFESAQNKVEIKISSGVGSINIK
jgi:hypothetical protein